MPSVGGIAARADREAEHFDKYYQDEARRGIETLSDFDKARYRCPSAQTIFPREFFYHLLAPLKGKDTLEIACGNGIDASICAYLGADVHAYDLSEQSIELTRRRAKINGLSGRVSLQVTGDFMKAFEGNSFDAILGYATLHHLNLDGLAEKIYERLRPGGVAVFAEPVINSSALDRVRKCIPYNIVDPTEDEHPLNDAQIARFARPFDRVVRREFQCISRIWPIFSSSWPMVVGLHQLDYHLMKVQCLRRFASVVVFGLYRDRSMSVA
jgi:2-polyprenyl-3-methyl-5-hydroxy-6-metoxy-1,4-benzoquinol methylase